MDMYEIKIEDWGYIHYVEAWARQQQLFNAAIDAKLKNKTTQGEWIMCEHEPIITLGKHGKRENLLFSKEQLLQSGLAYIETDRGGDITYHGPGQLVCYPILDLERLQIGLKEYIHRLEQMVIDLLSEYKIEAERVAGATGVWIDADKPSARKICAIGVRCSRHVTMHGLALNVNTNLSHFSYIHPCGFVDKGVTSLANELGYNLSMSEIKQKIITHQRQLFKESKRL